MSRTCLAELPYAEWGRSEVRKGVTSWLWPGIASGSVADLTRQLNEMYGEGAVLPVNAGRTALHLALELARQGRWGATRVLTPGYICPSAKMCIEESGLVAEPIDVGSDLNIEPTAARSRLSREVVAVLAAHMYGAPARIVQLERICAEAGVPLIDDAAQVLGPSIDGRLLGSFGQFGVLSFAQSKTIVCGESGSGGALLVNDPAYRETAVKLAASLASPRFSGMELLNFLWRFVWASRTQGLTDVAGALARRAGYFPTSARRIPPAKLAEQHAAIAVSQLRTLEGRIERRVSSLAAYAEALATVPGVELPQFEPGRYLTRLMVKLPNGLSVAKTRAHLSRRGVATRAPYPWLWRGKERELPVAADAQRLLELPCRLSRSSSAHAVVQELRRAIANSSAQGLEQDAT